MRETCARVLAAALMTGAIGFALAMPAVFGTGSARDAVRSLTAPPSSLQRSVPVVAAVRAPSPSVRTLLPEGIFSIVPGVPALAVPPQAPAAGPVNEPSSGPEPVPSPAPSPAPQPAPPTDTRTLANETAAPPVVQPAAPSQPAADSGKGKGRGKGKGKGRDKAEKAKPSEPEPQPQAQAQPQPQPVPATTPQPPAESAQSNDEKDHGHGHGNGDNGKGGNGKGGNGKEGEG